MRSSTPSSHRWEWPPRTHLSSRVLDDLHWACQTTLLLLRHLLRFGRARRVQIVGTYRAPTSTRSTRWQRCWPDLHRDGTADRIALGGLDESDVTAYVTEAGYDDEELARALASVTGGNPFFLIEALRHVEKCGGRVGSEHIAAGGSGSREPPAFPAAGGNEQGLAAAAVVGSRFALELVEWVVGRDLVDVRRGAEPASSSKSPAGDTGSTTRSSDSRCSPSWRPCGACGCTSARHDTGGFAGADDELLAELAYHYFEMRVGRKRGQGRRILPSCGGPGDDPTAHEGAADLCTTTLHALEERDEEPPTADQTAELLVARCEAPLAAGDVASAVDAVSQLQAATLESPGWQRGPRCVSGRPAVDAGSPGAVGLKSKSRFLGGRREARRIERRRGKPKAHTSSCRLPGPPGEVGDCETVRTTLLPRPGGAREHRR